MTLTRLPDWRSRLEKALDAITYLPFEWGSHDCGPSLAGRVVYAVTGEDVAAPWRGRYSTRAGALKVMRSAGFDNLGDLVASTLPEIHPSRARVGDLAAFPMDTPFGFALGVVTGERVHVLKAECIGTVGLLQCTRAFKVG